ncbi:hypothetical protein L484_017315 [Morus notabilis]|uniref:Uncharacterized protein n=1 Tax=Morus notabilis TaxID=981085 RepID=W9S3F8_9ROSA|nr:hypothetical protein L484_017315 [Morus notabilis]
MVRRDVSGFSATGGNDENRRRQRESGAATVRIRVGDGEKRLERGARERSRATENFLRTGRRRRRSGVWRRGPMRVSEEDGEERE